MASGTLGDNDLNSRERLRWGDSSKVYTRKIFHQKGKKNSDLSAAAAPAPAPAGDAAALVYNEGEKNVSKLSSSQTVASEETKSSPPRPPPAEELPAQENPAVSRSEKSSSSQRGRDSTSGEEENRVLNASEAEIRVNGVVKPVISRVEDRVRINLAGGRSADEIRELRKQLKEELDQVRILAKKLEAKELELAASNKSNGIINQSISNSGAIGGNYGSYSQSHPQQGRDDVAGRRTLVRVNSEVGSVGHQESRPFRPLSVSVRGNNHGVAEFVEKEKRTPKANQYYRNSEFLLGKDRLPPESNKKLKPNGGRKHGGEAEYGFGFGFDKQRNQVFRSCSNLLQRLMKHKHSWVFNEPVNAKALGLHDYHDIIKHPMDLGTIKTRLSQNWYKSPREFAEDVRLVFRNAMTYNPKGQDVHYMAEVLSQIFEERWAVMETEYNPDWRYQMYHDAGLPTPTSRKAPPPPLVHASGPLPLHLPSAPQVRALDRSESMTAPMKPSNFGNVGRTPAPKKPKAKDPNKRDMTYEEKQRLSTNLQSLPSEKLDAIVQIIKKRNSALSQHDDEIEVDIDSVDAETLWELDRFVTNYKKSLSKNKRKAELALQARTAAAQAIPITNPTPAVADAHNEVRIGEKNTSSAPTHPSPSVEGKKQGDNASRSSSSSSSSSDSGSSSSDSDSDSSSAYGSDAGHSPQS